uniref:BRO1 domain-containing protein n=1 Tax=Panagrellus redivivus TaxID=6233 RepID=A0A7E4W7L0_PANRE
MASFIAIDLKKTHEVDLTNSLKSHVEGMKLTPELNAEFIEGLTELNKLRSKATSQNIDRTEQSLQLLERYYDQLKAIENKLPITANVNPIAFKWKDAFDKGFFGRASLTLSEGSYERACVLFNVGALMSQVAASQANTNDDGLRSAAGLFQKAAGVFAHLKDTVLSLIQQEPTSDLMPETLAVLSALMLAQAQECVFHKASKDSMKPTAIVKVANMGASLYAEVHMLMGRDVVKGIFDKDWVQTVAAKQRALEAAANFYAAQVAADESAFGVQICRLLEAVKISDELKGSNVENQIPVLRGAAAALKSAQRDNDFIYRERIPDIKTLEPLAKATVVKAIPLDGPLSPRFKDLFESLVPVSIQNALSAFEARKTEVVNVETGRLREYTQLMNAQLTSMNLPAALDDVINHEKCPESIRHKSSKVKTCGGAPSIVSKMDELPSLYKRNEEILNETARILAEEKNTDDNLRNQFREKWTRLASDKLTGPLSQEIAKYRGIMNNAQSADQLVKTKYEQNRWGIELLSRPENELKDAIPGLGNLGGAQSSQTITELRELIARTGEIKTERENLEKSIKNVRFDMSGEFLQSMSGSDVVNEETLSNSKIQQLLGPLKDNVAKSIAEQEVVMDKIQQLNKRFVDEKAGSGTAERDNVLKTLATAYDSYFELEGNLKEGTKFYNDLTPMLLRLQQKANDFCFARQTEKDDLMKQVQQNIVSGGGGGGKAPPPRPPPPSANLAAHEPPPSVPSHGSAPPPPNHGQPGGYPLPPPQHQPPQYHQPQQPYPQQPPHNPYMQYQPGGYGYPPPQPYAYNAQPYAPQGYQPYPMQPQQQQYTPYQAPLPQTPQPPYPTGNPTHPTPNNTNPFM